MRIKHKEIKDAKEPFSKWKWKRYHNDESHKESSENRASREEKELWAEKETDRDLNKSIEQLLTDFNMAYNHSASNEDVTKDTKYILQAQRRMVAMMAQVALSNKRSNWLMMWLTGIITILTIITTILAYTSFIESNKYNRNETHIQCNKDGIKTTFASNDTSKKAIPKNTSKPDIK